MHPTGYYQLPDRYNIHMRNVWNWRILASQIYQESRFDPEIASWAGCSRTDAAPTGDSKGFRRDADGESIREHQSRNEIHPLAGKLLTSYSG